ncbi:ATP-binding protein [Apibacter sp. HY039]|uniref:ATP-binding protein n=1 Tax=Apibacter sp. HY039 TaxID=2501476 RepID=UPI000FEBAA68|nr:ATP-binding protein [Apibacter sp. HY039]
MSFKLLAIRPLEGCNSKFRKNLKEGGIYKFYNNYEFIVESDGITRIEHNSNKEVDLYSLDTINPLTEELREITINISAIVGKNGSGKSSLVELLYVSFYKISRICEIIKIDDVISTPNIGNSSVFTALENVKKIIKEGDFSIENKLILGLYHSLISEKVKTIMAEGENKINYDENTEDIKVEIIYEIDSVVYLLRLENDTITLRYFSGDKKDITIDGYSAFKKNIDTLFYNLVINYSLYGLNTEESGKWIEKVFHKNDSYQTPIVLNPYRDKGNIDINSENYLVRSRLLAIIFDKGITNKKLVEEKEVKRIKLSYIDKSSSDTILSKDEFIEKVFPQLYEGYFKSKDLASIDFELKEGVIYDKTIDYILRKITLIIKRYPTFKNYTKESLLDASKLNDFVMHLYRDHSHITLKLRQALYFYRYQNYVDDDILENDKIFPIQELENKINKYDYPFADLIDLVPPSFFKIELYFSNNENNIENNFSNLSSGEKQKIYSLNSIIYHLRNLLSVNFNSRKEELLVYKNFNIILDEIELYYHPEQQKSFINDLLDYIAKIDFSRLKNLPNINIIFITHSPFILSDIPKENILFLKDGKPEDCKDMNTFGANISDLLVNSFFLEDGLMGNFVKKKIEDTIDWLNKILEEKEKLKLKHFKKDNKFEELSGEKEYHQKLINLIDEPIIKSKLQEMYSEVFGDEEKIKYLESEKKKLEDEIRRLESNRK